MPNCQAVVAPAFRYLHNQLFINPYRNQSQPTTTINQTVLSDTSTETFHEQKPEKRYRHRRRCDTDAGIVVPHSKLFIIAFSDDKGGTLTQETKKPKIPHHPINTI